MAKIKIKKKKGVQEPIVLENASSLSHFGGNTSGVEDMKTMTQFNKNPMLKEFLKIDDESDDMREEL